MKKLSHLTLALLIFSAAAHAETPAPSLVIKATTDRPDAIYKTGETVTFTVEATREGKPWADGKVTCVLSKDGVQPQPAKTLELKDGKATLTGTLGEPGFLSLRVTGDKVSAMAGAAFDPLSIKPSMAAPDDFDSFWAARKAELKKIPAKATLTPVPTTAKGIETFDLQVDCLGAPVSGYFGRPLNAKPKSLPAVLFTHGAGVGGANLGATNWAANEGGMLALDINAHGIANGKPKEFYDELNKGALNEYRYVGRTDRSQNYFKGMFLRLIRAIDFLTAQPEWDGKTVIVFGSSQGGFQAFAAAGLDERVTFICAGVPAGCDHTGVTVGRINGWPKLVPLGPDGKVTDQAALETARYFDCVNFAQRVKCKGAAVTVGFIDTTCPPTSVYAAYDALPVPKTIHTDPLSGHTSTPAASKFMQEAAFKHVREMK